MAVEAANKGFSGAVSAGPLGTVARLLWFVVLCLILLVIGLVKVLCTAVKLFQYFMILAVCSLSVVLNFLLIRRACKLSYVSAIFGPLATLIFFFGIMGVVVGLWPVYVVVMFRAVATTKKLGVVMKVFLLFLFPIPMLLWPLLAAVGSILVGLGYGIGQPLVGTFEAVGEGRENKLYHVFVDGTWSTARGACTSVRDFYDFVYHSVCDMVEEFRLGEPKNGKPLEIKLQVLPVCVLVGVIGVIVDTPAISVMALLKMPIMLYKGWRRLMEDLVTRHGPCLEAACVPFAGLALIFWPFVVVMAAFTAFLCSPLIGLFSAIVVYQEMSYKCGLKYIVAIVAEFDEYSNDILHTQEGSCLPRPKYRKNMGNSKVDASTVKSDMGKSRRKLDRKHTLEIPQLNTQKSLRHTIQEVKLVHILDTKFESMERQGKSLINAGIMKYSDIDAGIKGNKVEGQITPVELAAYVLVIELIRSAKSNSTGIILYDGTEVNMSNRPTDRLADWFFEPILTIKDQLRACHLQESEERYLEKLCLMIGNTERMESWQNGGVEPEDPVRKGELQALARRLQGISTSISRIPTHRRRTENLMKNLEAYMESMGGNPSRQKDDMADQSKSVKLKSRSYNFRTIMREGSNRFFPPTVPAGERLENSKEITPNVGDQAV